MSEKEEKKIAEKTENNIIDETIDKLSGELGEELTEAIDKEVDIELYSKHKGKIPKVISDTEKLNTSAPVRKKFY